jgi:DAK2 domain fusion protein YloV
VSVTVLEAIDARAARRWALAALAALGEAREQIDAVNVFPVADGDTGTNLYLTLESAAEAVAGLPGDASLRDVAEAFARGALLGARGNSGVIAAQLLRSWADVLGERGVLDADAARLAARRADEAAWEAVAEPVEGTMLSVSRAAARAAAEAGPSLADVVAAMAAEARLALARTPDQLETLRRAHVVDAGGQGLLLLIEALADVVLGTARRPAGQRLVRPELPVAAEPDAGCPDADQDGRSYEVMYLLEATDESVRALRTVLTRLGDSVVVVGGRGLWHVHVHLDDAGAAVEAGLAAGRPRQVRINYLDTTRLGADRPAASGAPARAAPVTRLVACAAGPGLARVFAEAGASVVEAAPGRRPDTDTLLAAIRGAGPAAVVVLPNDPQTRLVAEAAATLARADGMRVTVLPTRAQVQGLAAVAVHDPARAPDDDVVRMSSAAAAARDGAVTVAARDAMTTAGPCHAGDALGVVQGDFVIVGSDLATVAGQVLDRLLSGGGELVTVVAGRDADPELVRAAAEHARRSRLDVEVHVLEGGQDRYPLLLGVE